MLNVLGFILQNHGTGEQTGILAVTENTGFGCGDGAEPTGISELHELQKKMAVLELELARALAVETFLDCDYKKVKVSKRIAKAPKSKIRAKSTRCVAESLKGSKPTIRTSSVFN